MDPCILFLKFWLNRRSVNPCIPMLKFGPNRRSKDPCITFQNSDRFGCPWIPASHFKSLLEVFGKLFSLNLRSDTGCIPFKNSKRFRALWFPSLLQGTIQWDWGCFECVPLFFWNLYYRGTFIKGIDCADRMSHSYVYKLRLKNTSQKSLSFCL